MLTRTYTYVYTQNKSINNSLKELKAWSTIVAYVKFPEHTYGKHYDERYEDFDSLFFFQIFIRTQ